MSDFGKIATGSLAARQSDLHVRVAEPTEKSRPRMPPSVTRNGRFCPDFGYRNPISVNSPRQNGLNEDHEGAAATACIQATTGKSRPAKPHRLGPSPCFPPLSNVWQAAHFCEDPWPRSISALASNWASGTAGGC